MKHLAYFILAFSLFFCVPAKLPNTFIKCNRKQNDFDLCLTKSIGDAVHRLDKPLNDVSLPSLEPLEIPSIKIGAGRSAVGFEQNYKNLKLRGFTKSKINSAKMDFKSKTLHLSAVIPELVMAFDYEINGKILVLPITGKGPGEIKLLDLGLDMSFTFKEYEKGGLKYFKIDKSSLKMSPKLITFKLDNLFDGDENLGKTVNGVLNDNWQDVFGDVKGQYEEAYREIFTNIFGQLLDKVSAADLFGD